MNLKKTMCIAVASLGVLSACGEKKHKDNHSHSNAEDEAKEMMSKEVSKEDSKIEMTKERVADSLRKVDSLRQVKEHGHAH